ncbi:MAG: exonuclease domain-containing protein [Patescibacteria group bacterium]|nr:exonuclease domain-containing protein [Patescibacteria group bacterium]
MKHNLLFLDTETTGMENGRVVQLAYKKEGDADTFVAYYKPPIPIEIEAMVVHHITEKHVADKPAFATSETRATLSELLTDSILVAHNAKFDIGILANEGVSTQHSICTLKVAQTMYDYPMYKLQYLRYLWGIDIAEALAHDARGDVAVLEKAFEHMATEYAASHNLTAEETIEAFVEITRNPILLRRASFGKYVGKTFEEIKKIDRDYLRWMGTLKDKDEDFLYTVQHHLS